MPYADKDKQKQAVKEAVQRHRQGITEQGITPDTNVIPSGTITDATGQVYPIDYEGRARDKAILDAWYAGKGTVYQQRLATLGRQYL